MKRALPLLAGLALAACVAPPINDAPIPRDGEWVELHQSARAGPLIVTPRAVVEDSRCPINARCVWAGRIIVRADVAGAGERETRDFELGRPEPVGAGTLALTSAEPGKLAGTQTDPRAYRFTFAFSTAR